MGGVIWNFFACSEYASTCELTKVIITCSSFQIMGPPEHKRLIWKGKIFTTLAAERSLLLLSNRTTHAVVEPGKRVPSCAALNAPWGVSLVIASSVSASLEGGSWGSEAFVDVVEATSSTETSPTFFPSKKAQASFMNIREYSARKQR